MVKVQVVKHAKGLKSYTGIGWREAFELEDAQVGEVRVRPKAKGDWHSHGKRTLYGYVVSGKSRLEFVDKGIERVTLSKGDFFLVPPGLVHRDLNPYRQEAVIMIFNVGPGPASFDAPGPK
jgi:uncharacterized RmlC-like cupin family protein